MIDLEDLYFEWLLSRLDPDGVTEGAAYLCGLLHNCDFRRRVGNDINRSEDGINLRQEFFTQFDELNFGPNVTNELMAQDCSWLEMLIALARRLDYVYDGGVDGRFSELVRNLEIDDLAVYHPNLTKARQRRDQRVVDEATSDVDDGNIERNGQGGLFPLRGSGYPDQRRVELWDQAGAYFNEYLEGV